MKANRWLKSIAPTIHLRRKSLGIAFLLSALFITLMPAWGFVWRIHYFLPPLVIALYQRSLTTCLWFAIMAGISMDIISGSDQFGLYPLAYAPATALIFRFKRFFFADSWFTVPALTAIGSIVATTILLTVLSLVDKNVAISSGTVLIDCLAMSCADALFAFVLFVMPALLLRQRAAEEYFAG